jgi:hypothetical protein
MEVVHMEGGDDTQPSIESRKDPEESGEWMKRMSSQRTKSELVRRLTPLPPLRLFV